MARGPIMSAVVLSRLSIRAQHTGENAGFWLIDSAEPHRPTIKAALRALADLQQREPAAGWRAYVDGRPADVETLAVLAKMAEPPTPYTEAPQDEPATQTAASSAGQPLGVLELRAALLAQGFTEYQTMAGWRPIEQFDPYGMAPPTPTTPAGKNWGPKWTPYEGVIVTDAGETVIRDYPGKDFAAPLVLGGFPVRKATTAPYFYADCGRNDFYTSDGKMIEGPNERHAFATAQLAANASNEGVRVMNPPHSTELVLTNDPEAKGTELAIVDPDEPETEQQQDGQS